jgi:two-component system sensor histidine kinase ChvG
MALETERTPAAAGLSEIIRSGSKRIAGALGETLSLARPLWRWLTSLRVVRFFSQSLLRRILVTNLIGLVIMIGGIHYLSQYHAWLIDAKRESLRVQGEMIAAAIASDARVETGNLVVNADKLPGVAGSRAPYRDDGFSALELSIRPERVTPILRRLIQQTKNRARVYSHEGALIVDSAALLTRGQLSRQDQKAADDDKPEDKPRTKNFWTRLRAWLIDQDLPVYKEIGNANGTIYKEVRMALAGTPTPMLLINEKGEQIVSMAVPIRRASAIEGVLLLSTRPGEIDKILSEERDLIWMLASIALLATIVTSFLLARTVAGPMRRLSEAAHHVSRDITARTVLPDYAERTDEVGQMAGAFAAMTAALYRRIEASESFAADVAHELKNPLTAARSTAEALAYAKTEEQRVELVKQIQNELKRLNRLITDVSNASRLDAELARQQMKPVDATVVMTSVAQIFRDILVSDTRRVVTIFDPAPFDGAFMVNGDAGRLGQVLTNLVDNAISFCPPKRSVTLRARHADNFVELIVEDEGPGIPEDRLDIIFERFYTDRPQTEAIRGKNSGLGLSISREIVRAHGGEIWAENRASIGGEPCAKSRGSRFIVRLPALMPAGRTATTRGGPARGGTTSGRRT